MLADREIVECLSSRYMLDPPVSNNYLYWVSAYTTMTDAVLAIMLISAFWNLQMRFPKKLSVCIMMGLTLLSAIVTISRLQQWKNKENIDCCQIQPDTFCPI